LDLNESSVNSFDDKNIIICVDHSIPDSFGNTSESPDTLELGSNIFELRCILLFESNRSDNRSAWKSECYARHGGGYTSWWHQARGDHMYTQYLGNIAIHLHKCPSSDPYFFNCTYVYVKCDSTFAYHWQQRFFRCMGGKTHIICQCNNMPFIPTNTWREVK
jgi:hypothetical protein